MSSQSSLVRPLLCAALPRMGLTATAGWVRQPPRSSKRRRRLARMARPLQEVPRPNRAQLGPLRRYELDQALGSVCLTMNFCRMGSLRSMVLSRSLSPPLLQPSFPSPLLLLPPLRLLLLTLPRKSPSRPKTDKPCPMTTPSVCHARPLVTTTYMFPAHHPGLSTAVSCILFRALVMSIVRGLSVAVSILFRTLHSTPSIEHT